MTSISSFANDPVYGGRNVSAIIPNFNGQALLADNLASVIAMLRSGDEIVIMDDASSDNSCEWLKQQFFSDAQADNTQKSSSSEFEMMRTELTHPNKSVTITLIKNRQNLRFAATCNRAVEQAKHELVFLINTDVQPAADILKYLLPHFNNSAVFAVGCLEKEQTLEGEEEVVVGKNSLWFERGLFIHARATEFASGPTAWVSGGSGIFDKQKWLELKGFDPVYYPAYWEDVDLSFRARKKGWQVLFENQARVKHYHETTNAEVFGEQRITQMSWRNARVFTWRNGSLTQKMLFILWQPYWWWKRDQV